MEMNGMGFHLLYLPTLYELSHGVKLVEAFTLYKYHLP